MHPQTVALLRLKEPCLWREDQILQSNMYEAARLYTHTFLFFFIFSLCLCSSREHTSPRKHGLLRRRHRGAEGTHEGIDKHRDTISHQHIRRGIQMIYLQFNTCTVGPWESPVCVVVCVIRTAACLSVSPSHTQQNKLKPTERLCSSQQLLIYCHPGTIISYSSVFEMLWSRVSII